MPFLRMPTEQEVKDAFKIELGFKREGEQAGQAVANGGREAKQAIEASAAFFKVAGYDVGAAIERAADKLISAAGSIGRMNAIPSMPSSGVNANTGRSMPAAAGRPAGTGPQ